MRNIIYLFLLFIINCGKPVPVQSVKYNDFNYTISIAQIEDKKLTLTKSQTTNCVYGDVKTNYANISVMTITGLYEGKPVTYTTYCNYPLRGVFDKNALLMASVQANFYLIEKTFWCIRTLYFKNDSEKEIADLVDFTGSCQ